MFSRYLPLTAFFLAIIPLSAATETTAPAGVHNFHQVDAHVYRGAQPTDEGFHNLAKLGIKTVVDLQETGTARSRAEERWVTSAGMQYVTVPMKGMETPASESVLKVLSLLEDSSTGPVFVHCHRGADRTGAVIACYRIEHDHWQNDKALSEARSLGMSWFQTAIQKYVRGYSARPLDPQPKVLATDAPPSPALALTAAAPSN